MNWQRTSPGQQNDVTPSGGLIRELVRLGCRCGLFPTLYPLLDGQIRQPHPSCREVNQRSPARRVRHLTRANEKLPGFTTTLLGVHTLCPLRQSYPATKLPATK